MYARSCQRSWGAYKMNHVFSLCNAKLGDTWSGCGEGAESCYRAARRTVNEAGYGAVIILVSSRARSLRTSMACESRCVCDGPEVGERGRVMIYLQAETALERLFCCAVGPGDRCALPAHCRFRRACSTTTTSSRCLAINFFHSARFAGRRPKEALQPSTLGGAPW
jgi:hypothetical protein